MKFLLSMLLVLSPITTLADTPHIVATIRSVNPKSHSLVFAPMYPLELRGTVLSGSFVERDQLRCKIVNRPTGDFTEVPDNNGGTKKVAVTVMVLVCNNGGEIRIDKVMFPE